MTKIMRSVWRALDRLRNSRESKHEEEQLLQPAEPPSPPARERSALAAEGRAASVMVFGAWKWRCREMSRRPFSEIVLSARFTYQRDRRVRYARRCWLQ
jgi:hypothetical protein